MRKCDCDIPQIWIKWSLITSTCQISCCLKPFVVHVWEKRKRAIHIVESITTQNAKTKLLFSFSYFRGYDFPIFDRNCKHCKYVRSRFLTTQCRYGTGIGICTQNIRNGGISISDSSLDRTKNQNIQRCSLSLFRIIAAVAMFMAYRSAKQKLGTGNVRPKSHICS